MLKHSLKRVYVYKLDVVNLIAKRSVVIISNSGGFDFGNNCRVWMVIWKAVEAEASSRCHEAAAAAVAIHISNSGA